MEIQRDVAYLGLLRGRGACPRIDPIPLAFTLKHENSMIVLLVGFMLLASSYTTNKFLLDTLPISLLSAFKLIVSGTCFLTIIIARKSWPPLLRKIKADLLELSFICIFATSLPYFLKMYALKHLNSSLSLMIGSLDPFITTGYAYLLFKERVSLLKLCGIFLGFLSVLSLFYYDCLLNITHFNMKHGLASLQGLLAIVVGRYGWIRTQKLLTTDRYTIVEMNFIILVGGGLSALVTFQLGHPFSATLTYLSDLKTVLLLLYTTLAGNIFAYYIYMHRLKKYPVTWVSYAGLIIPITGHLLGALFLHEQLSKMFVLSIALMFFSYQTYFYAQHKKPSPAAV